jgi:protein-tyrosine phosphatase
MLAQVYWIEGLRLGIVPRPRGGDWLEDDIEAWREARVDAAVSLLEAHEAAHFGLEREAEICAAREIRYFSLPIVDRSVPDAPEQMAALAETLSGLLAQSLSVVAHCRQSVGRASLLAACVMSRNGFTVDEAFARITRARRCETPETPEQLAWAKGFATLQK